MHGGILIVGRNSLRPTINMPPCIKKVYKRCWRRVLVAHAQCLHKFQRVPVVPNLRGAAYLAHEVRP